ncbi:FRIGIDA-like protein 1 [Bienertia sinuspersici]
MISSDQVYSEIKLAESLIQDLQSQFSHQWSSLQNSLKKIQSSLQNRTKELESKEQRLNLIQKSIEERQKEVEFRENQLNSTERFVCDRCKTLGINVSETGNVVVKIEPSTEFEDDYCNDDASIKLFVTMDGKTLQMFLNDRVDEHDLIAVEVKSALKLSSDPAKLVLDAMEGFFSPHLKRGKLEYEGIVVRSSCVLLLEQLIELKPEIKKPVREEARALARSWIEKVRAERGSYMMVLGFLLLIVVYRVWSDFDKDELRCFCDAVQQHRVAGELRSKLGFLPKCGMSTMESQFQKEEPYTPPVKNVSVSPSNDSSIDLSTLCEQMNANGLKSYLIKHVKDLKSIDEKVLDCIRYASEPAKLIFKVVQEFYLELDEIHGEAYISCSNFLLDKLMKLSTHINSSLKEETINFAARWKARLAMESTKPFLVFGFLKFLAAYKLSNSFQTDELLSLFTMFYEKDDIYEPEQNPSLCRALDLIQSLIKENKQVTAVRYISTFNLANSFPPGPLLKAYLEYTKEAALKTCNDLNSSVMAQNMCATKQIHALQSIIRCIFDFKIDSEFSPIELQQQIRQLEKEREERNSLTLKKGKKGRMKRSATDTTQSDSKGMKKQAVVRPTTAQNSVNPYVSDSVASSTKTFNQPSSNFQQYGFYDSNYGVAHNIYTGQYGFPRMPYTSFQPSLYPVFPHPNFPSGVSLTPHFGTPSSFDHKLKHHHPSS